MIYGIYAMYDVAAKLYAQPFYQTNDDVAKRAFALTINNPEARELYPIRKDLELWCIGQFDDKSGSIIFKQNETDFFSATYPCRILSRGEAVIKEKEKEAESSDEV